MHCSIRTLFLAGAFCAVLQAQRDSATIVGTVRDPSGAIVPRISITIRDLDKNTTLTTISNEAGEYVATPLRPGRYNVTAKAKGFTEAVFEPVVVAVDQRLQLDITLAVATPQQQINVSAPPPPLNTEDMTIGQVIGTRQIEDMPLNGRNFQQLASLVPGAIPSYGARDTNLGGVSLSGTRSFDNSFLLDGVNNSTNTAEMPTRFNVAVSPNLDAIQEFKIQSSTYDAQYGGTGGPIKEAWR